MAKRHFDAVVPGAVFEEVYGLKLRKKNDEQCCLCMGQGSVPKESSHPSKLTFGNVREGRGGLISWTGEEARARRAPGASVLRCPTTGPPVSASHLQSN